MTDCNYANEPCPHIAKLAARVDALIADELSNAETRTAVEAELARRGLERPVTAAEAVREALRVSDTLWLNCNCARRGAEVVIGRLRGQRLGAVERELLLNAGSAEAPILLTAAQKASHSRAASSLVNMGLVYKRRDGVELKCKREYDRIGSLGKWTAVHYQKYTVRRLHRTAAGNAVVEVAGGALREGKRIRWEPLTASLLAAVPIEADDKAAKLRFVRHVERWGQYCRGGGPAETMAVAVAKKFVSAEACEGYFRQGRRGLIPIG